MLLSNPENPFAKDEKSGAAASTEADFSKSRRFIVNWLMYLHKYYQYL
jgi:hypothetical protein